MHPERGRITHCLVPKDLAAVLHEPLRAQFSADPSVDVVVERRQAERRAASERRRDEGAPPEGAERRGGRRRAGERRADAERVGTPALPPGLEHLADRIAFIERELPASAAEEDAESSELAALSARGDERAADSLHLRYYERAYSEARSILAVQSQAEAVTAQAFEAELHHSQRPSEPFRVALLRRVRQLAEAVLFSRRRTKVPTLLAAAALFVAAVAMPALAGEAPEAPDPSAAAPAEQPEPGGPEGAEESTEADPAPAPDESGDPAGAGGGPSTPSPGPAGESEPEPAPGPGEAPAAGAREPTTAVEASPPPSGAAVARLARRKFPDLLAAPTQPGVADADVRTYTSRYGAVVAAGGGHRALAESTLPLRSDGSRIDLDWAPDGSGFEPKNALTELSVPEHLGPAGKLRVGRISLIPSAALPSAANLDRGQLIYPELWPKTDLLVLSEPAGAALLLQLRARSAATSFAFDLDLPDGARLRPTGDGGAEVQGRSGASLASIAAPAAVDAAGEPVKTSYEVADSSIGLRVRHRDGGVSHPVLVDPVIESYSFIAASPDLTDWSWQADPAALFTSANDVGLESSTLVAETYSAGDRAAWSIASVGDSYIERVDFAGIAHVPQAADACTTVGIRASADGSFLAGTVVDLDFGPFRPAPSPATLIPA